MIPVGTECLVVGGFERGLGRSCVVIDNSFGGYVVRLRECCVLMPERHLLPITPDAAFIAYEQEQRA